MTEDLPGGIDKEDIEQLKKRMDMNWKAVRSAMLSFMTTDKKMRREDKEKTMKMRRMIKNAKTEEKFREVMDSITDGEIDG